MTKRNVEFDYFHDYESEQFAFYRIPKIMITNDYFRVLSCEAKLLYGLMLDRMSLSIKNKWIDKNNRVYIIFTLEQVTDCLNCGRDKAIKILSELDTKKGIGLIERVKQGFGKPDIIYVKSFVMKEVRVHEFDEDKLEVGEVEEVDLSRSEKPTCRGRKSRPIEVGKADMSKSENTTYRSRDIRPAVVGNFDSNNTNSNYTDVSNIYPINRTVLSSNIKDEKIEGSDIENVYMDIVKNNVNYDSLIQNCNNEDKANIDEIVELLVEVFCAKRDTLIISGAEYPYQFVKSKLLRVEAAHIRYILECLHNNTTKIKNMKAYLLACIFNSTSTINNYYQAEVNSDKQDNVQKRRKNLYEQYKREALIGCPPPDSAKSELTEMQYSELVRIAEEKFEELKIN